MLRKLIAALVLFAALTGAADAACGPHRILCLAGKKGVFWTPLNLGTSLVAWWDAQDTTNIVLSGSNVVSWTDKKGGVVASQGTGVNQFTYSATARNGKPGLTGNGTGTFMSFTPTGFPQTYSFLAVAGFSIGTANTSVFGYGAAVANQYKLILALSGAVSATDGFANTNPTISIPWNSNDLYVEWDFNAGVNTFYSDGGVANLGNGLSGGDSATLSVGRIGSNITGDGSFFNGVLQQLLVLNAAPSASQLAKLAGWESWYDGKAGSNLPVGSPYKTRPPYVSDP